MYAILARGGLRRFPADRPAAAAPVHPITLSPAEARRLLLAGQGWEGMSVQGALDFAGDARLTRLPAGLRCARLNVSGCLNLAALPERLDTRWLDVSDCPQLSHLPDTLRSLSVLELAGSGLAGLPPGLRVRLLWRGVAIDERTAFHADSLSGQDILHEDNAELRRVLLERLGYRRFLADVGGLILDRDHDPGGPRQLVRVPLDDDEDIVLLCVTCPSTGHDYVLRVPPHLRRCHPAAAWLAGFDNPDDYRPVQET